MERLSPAFMFCAPRSGSTLFSHVLDTHPDIAVPGELGLGVTLEVLHRLVQLTSARSWAAREVGAPAQIPHVKDLSPEAREWARAETRRLVTEPIEAYARAVGARVWLEKTPRNAPHFLGMIRKVFPDARFLCLYRNCMDVVHSILEADRYTPKLGDLHEYVGRSPDNLVAAAIDLWCDRTEAVLEHERLMPEQSARFIYEDLVYEPEATTRRALEHLGVLWDPGLLGRVFEKPRDASTGDQKIHYTTAIETRSVGLGSRIPYGVIPEPRRARMNGLLTELGYPTVEAGWNARPSPYVRAAAVGAAPATPVREASLDEIFDGELPKRLAAKAGTFGDVKTSIRFAIVGADPAAPPFVRTIVIEGGSGRVVGEVGDPECTITTEAQVLADVFRGKISPPAAVLSGALRVAGDLAVTRHLRGVFG